MSFDPSTIDWSDPIEANRQLKLQLAALEAQQGMPITNSKFRIQLCFKSGVDNFFVRISSVNELVRVGDFFFYLSTIG